MNSNDHIISAQNDGEKIDDAILVDLEKALDGIDSSSSVSKEIEKADEVVIPETEEPQQMDESEQESEELEDEALEDFEIKKPKYIGKENKYRKLQNDKYRAIAEKEEALRKVSDLERMLSESLNSSTYHYGKSAYADLERGKQNKKMALENSDIEGLVNADIEITQAISAINELKKWTESDKRRAEPVPEYRDDYRHQPIIEERPPTIEQEMAQDWLDNHSYLNPNSRTYNSALSEKVSHFVNQLDDKLLKNNQMDMYYTEDYFDIIDRYIDKNIKKKSATSTSHIGGVRHSHSPTVSGRKNTPDEMRLSKEEIEMCKITGISEKELREYKMTNK